jgi:hypothetical protein
VGEVINRDGEGVQDKAISDFKSLTLILNILSIPVNSSDSSRAVL